MNDLNQTQTRSLSRFFFTQEVPYGMAAVRIVLPLILLFIVIPRWPHARELHSSDGAATPLYQNYAHAIPLPIPSGTTAVGLTSLLALTLLTSSLGWCTRLSLIVSTILFIYLNLMDCTGSLTKYSAIAAHGLFCLSLSSCGSVWSIDSLLRRRCLAASGTPDEHPPRFPAWPRRLLQIMIGMVYLGAAFTKMHTPAFFSSDQMRQWMITNVNHSNPIGESLSFYPAMLVVSAYITVLWEILFVFLVWRGRARPVMLALGLIFHLGTTFLLGLYIFPLVCGSIYLAFLEDRDVVRFSNFQRSLCARGWGTGTHLSTASSWISRLIPDVRPRTATMAFGVLVLAVVAGGIETEFRIDPFGIRRAEGAHQLVELDGDQVRAMLHKSERIRESDKYLSFDIGSEMIADVVASQRTTFHHGEKLIAQCTLNPPHEDMYIECNLHDDGDRIIDRVGQIIDRNTLRCSWQYLMYDALPVGQYDLVFVSRGREITRRSFELLPAR
ncbi:MAG: HTTM domain-containing protein [Planctomycetaceae bacterium]